MKTPGGRLPAIKVDGDANRCRRGRAVEIEIPSDAAGELLCRAKRGRVAHTPIPLPSPKWSRRNRKGAAPSPITQQSLLERRNMVLFIEAVDPCSTSISSL